MFSFTFLTSDVRTKFGQNLAKIQNLSNLADFFFERMSPARWGHPDGCPPAWPAKNVVSGNVEKIRENEEHLVPRGE